MKTEFHTYLEGKARTDVAYEATTEAIDAIAENYKMETLTVTDEDGEGVAHFLIEKATGKAVAMREYDDEGIVPSIYRDPDAEYREWLKY